MFACPVSLRFPALQLNSYQYTAFMEQAAARQSMTQDFRRLTRDSSFLSNPGGWISSSRLTSGGYDVGTSSSSCCSGINCWGSQTYVTPAWWSLLVCVILPSQLQLHYSYSIMHAKSCNPQGSQRLMMESDALSSDVIYLSCDSLAHKVCTN